MTPKMSKSTFSHGTVVDIGKTKLEDYLRSRIQSSLIDASNKRETPYLPEELLFLEEGLYIWSDLVHHPKAYQTHDEMQLFKKKTARRSQTTYRQTVLL